MTLAASGYEESALGLAATMLSACAAWQTAVDAASSTDAQRRIVLRWGGDASTGQAEEDAPMEGDDGQPVGRALSAISMTGDEIELDDGTAWALLIEDGEVSHEEVAVGVWSAAGTIEILLTIPVTRGDQPWEILRRASNLSGTIAAQLRAQIGGSNALAMADVSVDRPYVDGVRDDRPTDCTARITLTWRA